MAQASWPSPGYNNRALTDLEYERLAARFSDDGVYGGPSDAPVVTPGAGLSVNIRAGVYASVRGHAWYSGASTVTIPLSSNISTQTRVDWVVLRLDRSAWTVRAVVKSGTPGAGAPVLTQDIGDTGVYEIPLARATVLAGGSSVTVTRHELYVGTRIRPCTSTTRNPSLRAGEMGYETDTGRVTLYDGQAVRTVYSRTELMVVNSILSTWEIKNDSVLEETNGIVTLRLGVWRRTRDASPNEKIRLPLLIPAAYQHPTHSQWALAYMTGARVARLEVYAKNSSLAGQAHLTQLPTLSKDDFVMPEGMSWRVG